MQFLDLTLNSPAENLALDEALLDWAEEQGSQAEFLRFWEPNEHFIVVGRSSRIHLEVDEAKCRAEKLPILRRSSGGATVLAGPGCLMYSVVLSYEKRPELRPLDQAHAFVLERNTRFFQSKFPEVQIAGTSDLILDSSKRKFSGNSLRCKRTHFLYHGTILYDFDLKTISEYLLSPPRQPEYRLERQHAAFVTNIALEKHEIMQGLKKAWNAEQTASSWPEEMTRALVEDRYATEAWTRCFD